MRREYLRDSFISALEGKAERYEVGDTDIKNFAVRVGSKTKVFNLVGRFGKATRMKIGTFGPTMKTEDARQIAKAWTDMMRDGIDIVEYRETERSVEAVKARSTFRSVMEDYLASLHLRERNRTVEQDRAFARRNILEAQANFWVDLPISQVTDAHISDHVDRIKARGATSQARKTLQMIRMFYKWTMIPHRRLAIGLTTNPVTELTPSAMSLKSKSRTRHFRTKEIRAFLVASAGVPYPYGPFQRSLIELGQRRGDTARMRWSQIDFDDRIWLIPGKSGKPDDDHEVHLSGPMVAMLQTLRATLAADHGDFVFSSSFGQRPISNFSRGKKAFDQRFLAEFRIIQPVGGLRQWTWHDVRRTMRTHFSGFVPREVAEAAIGHGKEGIEKVYDMFKYRKQLRAAFNQWSEILNEVLSGRANPYDDEINERTQRRLQEGSPQ